MMRNISRYWVNLTPTKFSLYFNANQCFVSNSYQILGCIEMKENIDLTLCWRILDQYSSI